MSLVMDGAYNSIVFRNHIHNSGWFDDDKACTQHGVVTLSYGILPDAYIYIIDNCIDWK